ncbi:hypothetical protein KC678_04245 [Candidatus Dojkabacteria bacterium]|uniref:Uncharacterized protein n=1 Tax=Candidatus Dojkabacteria bacterium TaxID=2099670 RepID=A0A955RH22_9BACT|nr:hypothetical protein [Candidatus Dojkabacteria bacterium]
MKILNQKKLLISVISIFLFIVILFLIAKPNSINNVKHSVINSPVGLSKSDLFFKVENLKENYDYVYEIDGLFFAAKYNAKGTISVKGVIDVQDSENSILSVLDKEKTVNNWDITIVKPSEGNCYDFTTSTISNENNEIFVGIEYKVSTDSSLECNNSVKDFVEIFDSIAGSESATIIPYIVKTDSDNNAYTLIDSINNFDVSSNQATVSGKYDVCFDGTMSTVKLDKVNKIAVILKLAQEGNCENVNTKDFELNTSVDNSGGFSPYLLISL